MSSHPSILKFNPIYKEKIWGGEKLKKMMGRDTPPGQIGESWELSDYGTDISRFSHNGELTNNSFRDLYQTYTESFLGKPFVNQPFPLLIKIIDAKEKLSVQVHPDDAYAEKYDPSSAGKKECWMVLSADNEAELVIGFEKDTDKESYKNLVLQNEAEQVLKKWKVKPGDVFLLNPGTIHAIGAGVLLLEVQQSSDSTYRVYDYGRLGDDGKQRELHLEKALAVLNYKVSDSREKQNKTIISFFPFHRSVFTTNDKFRLELWEFKQAQNLTLSPLSNPISFGIAHIKNGSMISKKNWTTYNKGDTVFITAEAFASHEDLYISENTEIAFMGAGSDWVNWS
ncbi:MAG: type I phosphomannose isomerase catalytic subunit [Leptospira sp.]|nr:type I phosphomannose isomerase catalytic subunit [Leptospira sp.]